MLELAQTVPPTEAFPFFGEYLRLGVVGLVAAGAIWFALRKDRELAQERKERLEDAKAVTAMVKTSSDAIDRLAEAVKLLGSR